MEPSVDGSVGVFRIHFIIDLRPGLMRERHLGELTRSRFAANGFGDRYERPVLILAPATDEHTADLDRGVLARVFTDAVVDRGFEKDAERLPAAARERQRW